MAGISQTIPAYWQGISEQSDITKIPGTLKDAINVIPDQTWGLYKRPGSKRIGTVPLTNVQSGGAWFHYYRDETEGAYIGQVAANGRVRMWRCTDGSEKNVWYDTDDQAYNAGDADHTAITNYLTTATPENIQTLTINDTTFITNRDTSNSNTKITTSGTTDTKPHTYSAFIEILRTENGRQYSMNIFDSDTETSVTSATSIKVTSRGCNEGDGSGDCAGIGTQVFVSSTGSGTGLNSSNAKNLVWKMVVTGQSALKGNASTTPGGADYQCTYNTQAVLLHGGMGWQTGTSASGTMTTTRDGNDSYTVTVDGHETTKYKGTVGGSVVGLIRPKPTPFDSDTAVSADIILGSLQVPIDAIGNISTKVIGNGIYIYSDSVDFTVEVINNDLMRVMQDEVNDVTLLPNQCKHGYIVKVSNAQESTEDDYYLKFVGEGDKDGAGVWKECPAPGIVKGFNASNMPHVLQRQADGDFLLKKYTWAEREVGDDETNPAPTFCGPMDTSNNTYPNGLRINKVLFFRNRLVFLSGENVICSQPGNFTEPSFWTATALTISAIDPIDIACSSSYPSDLFDGLEINTGLLVFSSNQQFILSSDDTVLNPDTAKLRSISTFNYNTDIPPISLGTVQAYVDNSGKYSKFNVLSKIAREGEPDIIDVSRVVPSLLPQDIDLLANSRENGLVLFSKTNTDIVYVYKYVISQSREGNQSSWVKWKHNNPINYHFCVDDDYYFLDTDNFLQSIKLIQSATDPSITQDDVNYLIHLDNWTTINGGVHNETTNLTTFTHGTGGCVFNWQSSVTTPNGDLTVIDTDTASTRLARYGKPTVTSAGATFTLPGNWEYNEEFKFAHTAVNVSNEQITLTTGSTDHGLTTGDEVKFVAGDTTAAGLTDGTTYYIIDASINNIALASSLSNANAGVAVNITSQGSGQHKIRKLIKDLNIGYLYEYKVNFPKIYMTSQTGQVSKSDANASVVVHRVKFNFGKIGLYETTLERVGKTDYTEIYETVMTPDYDVSDAPYLEEATKTIPVYEKNTNVDIVLKSSHPAPATLHSMSWEGNYTPKYYQRA